MIIIDIDKPKRCGQCPMHNDGTDYCKLEHDHASFVRARGCPIKTINPQETVTEFADRCKECGAKYGRLLKQKTGRWETEDMFDGDVAYRCSACNELFWIESGTPKDNGYNFCPNCGAKMEGGENGE